jgi:glucosamine--fructose-6-phosphate aminotransferase (isomerizing)
MLGRAFEAEIREQPGVWERIAGNSAVADLAAATGVAPVIFVGSGSSRFVAQFAALAYRRAGIAAVALAASEAAFDTRTHTGTTLVAISQSGRSADVLTACDALAPARLVALTNDAGSPLAQRAAHVVEMACGPERAVPASKSVSASLAIVRLAAALHAGERELVAPLRAAAADADAFLAAPHDIASVATRLAERTIEVVGSGYGVMLASEIALKFKEAAYVQAEGFSAGEFRHGSTAVLERTGALVGLMGHASRARIEPIVAEARDRGTEIVAFGENLGPAARDAFDPLRWLVTGQCLALAIGRVRGIDSDAPRGLKKALT